MKRNRWLPRCWAMSLVMLIAGLQHQVCADPRVEIVIAADAPRLERFAAEELASSLRRLYEAEVAAVPKASGKAPHVILVGSPATNPAIQSLTEDWPLSEQGHLLRSVESENGNVLIVGGGSPVSTLWAAYELDRHFGIRSLLSGDFDPVTRREFSLDNLDEVWEPTLRVRAWNMLGELPTGSASWGLDEHRALLRQLAKLKFNRVVLSLRAWQPFVDYEFERVTKTTATLLIGEFRVDGDTAGRGVFRGASRFENPDFAGAMSEKERTAAGIALARGIIESAQELGMTVGIAVSPLEFPCEFAPFLPDCQPIPGSDGLAVVPAVTHKPDEPRLLALARAQLGGYLKAYPGADLLYLTMPEGLDWSSHGPRAWQRLDARTALGRDLSLEKLSEDAAASFPADEGLRELIGTQIAVADFVQMLLSDGNGLHNSSGASPEILLSGVHPGLSLVMSKLDWQSRKLGAVYSLGETADRAAETLDKFNRDTRAPVPMQIVLPLAGDPRGVLPRVSQSAVERISERLANGGGGYVVQASVIGELDPAAYYLSRAGFSSATADQASEELIAAVLGDAVVERMTEGWAMLERATALVDSNDLDFDRLGPDVLLRHYRDAEDPPAWWSEAQDAYLGAMNEMYRVNTRARQGGRPVSLYFARRAEFGFHYFHCVLALRRAAQARERGEFETQFEELEKSLDSLDAALNAQAAIARGSSDRAVIALLNEYGYRPLRRELEALEQKLEDR